MGPAIRRDDGRQAWRWMLRKRLLKLIVIAGGVALIAIVLNVLAVTQSAWRIAGDSRYCIQVADGENRYKPARTLFDLSVLRLWGTQERGIYFSHHAILVVDRESNLQQRFQWSYWRQQLMPGFVPGLRNEEAEGYGSAVTCEPRPGFVGGLPWVIPETPDSDYVRFSAQEALSHTEVVSRAMARRSARVLATAGRTRAQVSCPEEITGRLDGERALERLARRQFGSDDLCEACGCDKFRSCPGDGTRRRVRTAKTKAFYGRQEFNRAREHPVFQPRWRK
jgi:hypothetical protein